MNPTNHRAQNTICDQGLDSEVERMFNAIHLLEAMPVQVGVACGLAALLGVTVLVVLEQLPRHHGEDAWFDD